MLLAPFLRNGISELMRGIFRFMLLRPWGPPLWRAQSAKFWPGLGDKASERAALKVTSMMRPGYWAAFQATVAGADHRVAAPSIGRVKAPVLVVIGDADPDWKDPVGEAKWVASNFKDVESLTVTGAGHAPMLERPAIVGPAVFKFLEKIRVNGAFKLGNS